MPRSSGRYGFSRVVWNHEIAASDHEDDSSASESEHAPMDVDSRHTPPQNLHSQFPAYDSPTPPLSETQEEAERAREIIGGIKLCGISVDPLNNGEVCYQGGNRFRILKRNWRMDAECRRVMANCEQVGTRSGNDATQPAQFARPSGAITPAPTQISSKNPSSTENKNARSLSTLRMNLEKKRKPTPSTQLSRLSKLTLRTNEQGKRPQGQILVHNGEQFPAAVATIWEGQEALACPTEGCGSHFTRLYDYFRHMRTVHKRTNLACRQCGHKFSRSDSLNRHARTVHSAADSILDGNPRG